MYLSLHDGGADGAPGVRAHSELGGWSDLSVASQNHNPSRDGYARWLQGAVAAAMLLVTSKKLMTSPSGSSRGGERLRNLERDELTLHIINLCE